MSELTLEVSLVDMNVKHYTIDPYSSIRFLGQVLIELVVVVVPPLVPLALDSLITQLPMVGEGAELRYQGDRHITTCVL